MHTIIINQLYRARGLNISISAFTFSFNLNGTVISRNKSINMRLFETSLNAFAFLGLEWDENSKQFFFAKKLLFSYILSGLCLISSIMFIIYDGNTFYDYLLAFTIFSGNRQYIHNYISHWYLLVLILHSGNHVNFNLRYYSLECAQV